MAGPVPSSTTSQKPVISELPKPDFSQATRVEQVASGAKSPTDRSPVRHNHPPRLNVVHDTELHAISKEAKTLEWKLTLEGIKQAYSVVCNGVDFSCEPSVGNRLYYFELRVGRILQKLYAVHGLEHPKDLAEQGLRLAYDLVANVRRLNEDQVENKLLPFFTASKLDGNKSLLKHHAKELYSELRGCFYHKTSFDYAVAEFNDEVSKVVELLETAGIALDSDPETHVTAILLAIRKALQTSGYNLMRCDESHPYVRLLHTIAIASFAHAETVPAYLRLGKAICDKAPIPRSQSFGTFLYNAREFAANSGFLEDDPQETFVTKIQKLKKVAEVGINSLRSGMPLFQTVDIMHSHARAFFRASVKDHKAYYGNNPGAYYQERLTLPGKKEVAMRVVLSASPALGSTVLPEFRALLQGIENRSLDRSHPYPYQLLVYSNMQKRYEETEDAQTMALMEQNEIYPCSFAGSTISVEPIKAETFNPDVKKVLLDELLAESSYTLDIQDRASASKYYFMPSMREIWKEVHPKIVDMAYKLVEDAQGKDLEKLAALKPIVNLGIVRFFEVYKAHMLSQTQDTNKASQMMLFRNCRAGVDRALMFNNQFLYILDPDATSITQATLGRSINDKGRLQTETATKATARITLHEQLNEKLKDYLQYVERLVADGIASGVISYPGCPDGQLPPKKKLFEGSSE